MYSAVVVGTGSPRRGRDTKKLLDTDAKLGVI